MEGPSRGTLQRALDSWQKLLTDHDSQAQIASGNSLNGRVSTTGEIVSNATQSSLITFTGGGSLYGYSYEMTSGATKENSFEFELDGSPFA